MRLFVCLLFFIFSTVPTSMVLVKEANEVIAPGKEEKLISLLPSEVYSIFREKFGFKTFTPVQVCWPISLFIVLGIF